MSYEQDHLFLGHPYAQIFIHLTEWDTSYIHRREAEKDTKIVGGKPAYPHSIPWQVALVFTNTSSIQCGGTIICDKYVLTAGKCS